MAELSLIDKLGIRGKRRPNRLVSGPLFAPDAKLFAADLQGIRAFASQLRTDFDEVAERRKHRRNLGFQGSASSPAPASDGSPTR